MNRIITSILLFIMFSGINAFSQRIEIVDVDPSDYPDVNVEFFVYDEDGDLVRNFADDDIEIIENGVNREVKPTYCPPPGLSQFSLLVILDMSNSMGEDFNGQSRFQGAIQATRNLISSLPDGRFECAIHGFANKSIPNKSTQKYPIQGFTEDKDELRQSLNSAEILIGTDYNSAFLLDINGDLGAFGGPNYDNDPETIAKNEYGILYEAKYKPYIIFLTDGTHEGPNKNNALIPGLNHNVFDYFRTLDAARTTVTRRRVTNTTIYIGLFQDINDLDSFDKSVLNTLVSQTGGSLTSNITNQSALDRVFGEILDDIGDVGEPGACNFDFVTDCDGGGEVTMRIPKLGDLDTTFTYSIPEDLKPYFEIDPRNITFVDVPPGDTRTVDVKLTAKRNFIKINDFSSTKESVFYVSDWGARGNDFRLNKDQEYTIKVSYTAPDDSCHEEQIRILESACDLDWINLKAFTTPKAENVNVGSAIINETTSKVVPAVYCNNTCDPINVTDIIVNGEDAQDFNIKAPKPLGILQPGDCLEIEVEFTPSVADVRNTDLIIYTDEFGQAISDVTGTGGGQPSIASDNPIAMPNADCDNSTTQLTFDLVNDGPLQTEITSISFGGTNPGDYSVVAPEPTSIPAFDSTPITVEFNPQGNGQRNATLIIESNAANAPTYTINLEGFREYIDYQAVPASIDFDVVCLNESATEQINVTNLGNSTSTVTITTDDPRLVVNPANIDLANAPLDVDLTLNGDTEGDVNATITFTDDKCNVIKTVSVSGVVTDPKFQTGIQIELTSTVGVAKDTTFEVRNNSAAEITILGVVIADGQFNTSVVGSNVIPPGGSTQINVEYTPDVEVIANVILQIQVEPCDKILEIPVIGNPSLAKLNVEVDEYTGFIGSQLDIDVWVRNSFEIIESGASEIDVTLQYDARLLEIQAPYTQTPVGGDLVEVELTGIQLQSSNNDQIIATLPFMALDGDLVITETPIEIVSAEITDAEVFISTDDGLFTLDPASATITIKTIEKRAGEEFDLNVYLSNVVNLDPDFHGQIITTITYNGWLFAPQGSTPEGTMNGNIRTIDLPVDIINTSDEQLAATFRFRAMLGNEPSTMIDIADTRLETGSAQFIEEDGEFFLLDLCEDETGTVRLWNPTGELAPGIISINPNPAGEKADLVINSIEEGMTSIELVDMSGAIVSRLYEGMPVPGTHQIEIDLTNVTSGVYFITMISPTQRFDKKIIINK